MVPKRIYLVVRTSAIVSANAPQNLMNRLLISYQTLSCRDELDSYI